MKRHTLANLIAAAALAASPTLAQDFSAGSTAKGWDLEGEAKALFQGRVTDVMCELTGDCPEDCGGGKRQMGLVRSADGALILAFKNSQAAFSGAAVDLALYCHQTVEVDGLLINNPENGAHNVFMVQKVRPEGGEWAKANTFTKVWAKEYPEAKGKGPWFRRDPRIKADIAENGYLGLGAEVDAAFIADWF